VIFCLTICKTPVRLASITLIKQTEQVEKFKTKKAKVSCTFRIDENTVSTLKEIAKEQQCTFSEVANTLLKDGLWLYKENLEPKKHA
jgi:Tfp pilus assembly protein PilO